MFFTVDAKEASKALGQIRRLRHRGNWKRIGSSDAYWTAAFAAALVEAVDSLLLEKPAQAYELSSQGLLLAERIRTEDCPGGTEVGKRSLRAWAQAVHGSSCRACERYEEAEEVFKQALWLAGSKAVLPWAAAEVDRRYAALLLHRGSVAGLTFVNRSIERYGQHTAGSGCSPSTFHLSATDPQESRSCIAGSQPGIGAPRTFGRTARSPQMGCRGLQPQLCPRRQLW